MTNETSILEDMQAMKKLVDEFNPVEKYRRPISEMDESTNRCEDCGFELDYEPGSPGYHDEPASREGWWCSNCETWSD